MTGQLAAHTVKYKRAAVFGYCVRSLADRATKLAAVVVADNASTGKTCHIAEKCSGLSVQVVDLDRNAGRPTSRASIAALLQPLCRESEVAS